MFSVKLAKITHYCCNHHTHFLRFYIITISPLVLFGIVCLWHDLVGFKQTWHCSAAPPILPTLFDRSKGKNRNDKISRIHLVCKSKKKNCHSKYIFTHD